MKHKLIAAAASLAILAGLILFLTFRCYDLDFRPASFTESTAQLDNPDRGFYSIRAFTISTSPQEFLPEAEMDHSPLELIQINLRKFSSGDITAVGLENVQKLFDFLAENGKRYLIRFLYDWDGNAAQSEPQSLRIIQRHMQQLAPIINSHADSIFLLQGLFVGNWGEMNGTPYTDRDSLQALASTLAAETDPRIFLSVRTPAHWRKTTGLTGVSSDQPLTYRLGLYNDGILGNSGDCGTYVGTPEDKGDPFASWCREDELEFQRQLCAHVPNGGEVILENPLNDFSNAVDALRTMHVTYLNRDYDQSVLAKWAAVTVTESGPYAGMDGLSYIDRHLGYRYLIDSAVCGYSWLTNRITVGAGLKNVGFAPAYSGKELILTLKGTGESLTYSLDADLRSLPGGLDSKMVLQASACIRPSELHETQYDVYLDVRDSGIRFQMANHEEPAESGWYLGRLSFARVPWYEAVAGRI